MNKKYEISVWNDIYDSELERYAEEKLAVIGSDVMTSFARARNPQLVSNVNGTNTFTFTMYYKFIDPETGEDMVNPFISYLINERKIKVYWKDKWYDLLIKDIKEDNVKRTFTYTCQDQFITELSRTGFELEFNTELENNIGTAAELAEKVLEGSDWQLLEGDTIYQKTEEPVYNVMVLSTFNAQINPSNNPISIQKDLPILVYYSCAPDENNLQSDVQFYYSGTHWWEHDENDMLVINGECCSVRNVEWVINTEEEITYATAQLNGQNIFKLNLSSGVSSEFRAERFVQSQKMIYNSILDRYVNVYVDAEDEHKEILGYQTTEYNDANTVVNLITNSSNFANTSGWIGDELIFKLSPGFDANTDITKYNPKSYLRVGREVPVRGNVYVYNTGIQNNRAYIPNGFSPGDRYIFRIKAKSSLDNSQYITATNALQPLICKRTIDYYPDTSQGNLYFKTLPDKTTIVDNWIEYTLECIKACSYKDIISTLNPFGLFIQITNGKTTTYWIEDVQLFREVYGEDGTGAQVRIEPNKMDTSAIAQVYWRYFLKEQSPDVTKDSLEYIHTSLGEWSQAIPVYNNFEKYGTIEASNSNRFNILQTIAETFQVWIRFVIEHDENGYILVDDKGHAKKYIQLVEQVGEERGVNFVYGIDLKTISRRVDSSSISTKTIVLQNENEFGKNGFCSIARSNQNYPKENFIYNFDYFIQQGLLDRDVLNRDLYGTLGLHYYYSLHQLNTEYADNLDNLIEKKQELTRQISIQKVYEQYISSALDELSDVENDILRLTDTDSLDAATKYLQSHADYTKVTTLVGDRAQIKNTLVSYQDLLNSINRSVIALQTRIDELNNRQSKIIDELFKLNKNFYYKYSRYIQEGTWNSEDYYDDDLYYLDALQVAYTSSRPKITYTIDILRLSDIPEYQSKQFDLGDICTIQDTEYFGYLSDKITPYKEKIFISEITSNFDNPNNDSFKVQNYKTEFDDLFQRITAATQNLEFSSGKYARAANIVNSDGTIKSSVIQNTFDNNKDLVYGAQNESATFDNTGITVTNNEDGSKQVKVTSGGIFITNDGGVTWKNAVRGDGITADVLTAGKINTEQITVYNGEHPGFMWDGTGINAYSFADGTLNLDTFVRFDQFGLYGVRGYNGNFTPTSVNDIKDRANFGMTWDGFFLRNSAGSQEIVISNEEDIVIKKSTEDGIQTRLKIGQVSKDNYGMRIWDNEGNLVFSADNTGAAIAGWMIKEDALESSGDTPITIRSDGNIGCYASEPRIRQEEVYKVTLLNDINVLPLSPQDTTTTIPAGKDIYLFTRYISGRTSTKVVNSGYNDNDKNQNIPVPSLDSTIQLNYEDKTYELANIDWNYTVASSDYRTERYQVSASSYNDVTAYSYTFNAAAVTNNKTLFELAYSTPVEGISYSRYVPGSDLAWSIQNDGTATFFNIQAQGGTIAGWNIDEEKIWSEKTKTVLSSAGTAKAGNVDYSIVTNAINAAMGSLGGVLMSGGLINGYNIAKVNQTANAAMARANAAFNLANGINVGTATSKATEALSKATNLENRFWRHTHLLQGQIRMSNASLNNGQFVGIIQKFSTNTPG